MKRAHLLLSGIFLLLLIKPTCSTEQVIIEFLYLDPSLSPYGCPPCSGLRPSPMRAHPDFLNKSETLNRIQNDYGSQVLVERIEYYSPEGLEKASLYNVIRPNSIVINGELVIAEDFDEAYIREVIDAALEGTLPSSPVEPRPLSLVTAFSLGFFETFSPCLLALLSFVLSFTVGKTSRFKESFLHVMTFGMGFVSAVVLLGVTTVALTFFFTPMLQNTLMLGVCIFAILFGIIVILFGLMNKPFQTKPVVKELARKYAATYIGLFLLGFLFYFLDPCIALLIFPVLVMLQTSEFVFSLFVFCVGVVLPFVGIGILAGSISTLVRSAYRHRSTIRVISGFILVVYGFYLIIFIFKH